MIACASAGVAVDSAGFNTVLAVTAGAKRLLVIVNNAALDGFWSIDGGTTQARWVTGEKKLGIPLPAGGAYNVAFKCDAGVSGTMFAYAV